MNNKFTTKETNFSKGIAVCLLIIHHLFWDAPNIGYSINGVSLSQRIGIIGKVCVAIFIILSGYGLNESAKNKFNLKKYCKKRFVKLYPNYWFIIISSLIIGRIFFYDKIFKIISAKSFLINLLKNMSGLQYIFNYKGFNGAWWYVTLTVICYCLFPAIRLLIKKYNHIFMIFSSLLLLTSFLPVSYFNMINILPWVFHFILGVYLSHNNGFETIGEYVNRNNKNKYIKIFAILLLLFIILFNRQYIGQNIYGISIDSLLGFLIILVNYLYISRVKVLDKVMVFLGEHSMNIFLIHMFITHYYTRDFTYSLKYPALMFIFVLGTSLIISIIIKLAKDKICELIKRRIHS